MVKCGVFFAVRTEFFNIIYTRFGFKGLNRFVADSSKLVLARVTTCICYVVEEQK
jgi:hypothetical protein